MSDVDILLPTFNGASWLPELLDSVLAQSFTDWTLWARDDGSTDSTVDILTTFAKREPRIRLVTGGSQRLGAAGNVGLLLEGSTAAYSLLCDQDDVWNRDKVAFTVDRLRRGSRGCPVLVHGDLEVVGEQLQLISPSFWEFRALDPIDGVKFSRLLVRNVAVGCTMGMNAALRRRVTPIPAAAYMHDWWIALVAAGIGEIHRIDTPLIRYRQHSSNTVGAGVRLQSDLVRVLREPKLINRYYARSRAQAAAILSRFGDELSARDSHATKLFAHGARGVLRPVELLKANVRDSSLLRNAALLAFG